MKCDSTASTPRDVSSLPDADDDYDSVYLENNPNITIFDYQESIERPSSSHDDDDAEYHESKPSTPTPGH